jgi:hypothetical protein
MHCRVKDLDRQLEDKILDAVVGCMEAMEVPEKLVLDMGSTQYRNNLMRMLTDVSRMLKGWRGGESGSEGKACMRPRGLLLPRLDLSPYHSSHACVPLPPCSCRKWPPRTTLRSF